MCALLCLLCAVKVSSLALARIYLTQAAAKSDIAAATRAVSLAPGDPESYEARSRLWLDAGNINYAEADLTHAVALSGADWKLWLELGDLRRNRGDVTDALKAYSQAAQLAPGHAAPHWRLANCLLDLRLFDESFSEFRLATKVTPSLLSPMLELAWRAYDGDVQAFERAVMPTTVDEKIALGRFLSKQGHAQDAARWMRAARFLPEDERLSLLKDLLDSESFEEAYAVWSSTPSKSDSSTPNDSGSVSNGGFEDEIDLHDVGFSWQFRKDSADITTSLDPNTSHSGRYSLRVDWQGDPDRSHPVVQQLVLVRSKTRYRLKFAARKESRVMVCGPQVTVADGRTENVLTASPPLTQEPTGWNEYEIEFTTGSSKVLTIGITRETKSDGPCPILGTTWFDDFSLELR